MNENLEVRELEDDKYSYELFPAPALPSSISPHDFALGISLLKHVLGHEKVLMRVAPVPQEQPLESYGEARMPSRASYQTGIPESLESAKTEIKAYDKAAKKAKIVALKDQSRKQDDVRQEFEQNRISFSHKTYDTVIYGLEQNYHETRSNVRRFMSNLERQLTMKFLLRDIVAFLDSGKDGIAIYFADRSGCGEAVRVAKIYLGDARFVLSSTVAARPVYTRRGDSRQYVKDCNGIFVKRYVYRNLATYDVENFADFQKNGCRSRFPPPETTADFRKDILNHLRGASQTENRSYFISATTSKNDIFGSLGKNFYTPASGQIIIDLANIPQSLIIDVHAIRAIRNVLGATHLTWGAQFIEGDAEYEKNAAVRDTVRTRELLIISDVPAKAIVAIRRKNFGDGSWYALDGGFIANGSVPHDVFIDPPPPTAGRKSARP